MITKVDTWEEFKRVLDEKGGFLLAHWDGTVETEVAIKGGHEGHDPLHSGRCTRRGGRLRLLREAVAPPRAVRPQLLISDFIGHFCIALVWRKWDVPKYYPSAPHFG